MCVVVYCRVYCVLVLVLHECGNVYCCAFCVLVLRECSNVYCCAFCVYAVHDYVATPHTYTPHNPPPHKPTSPHNPSPTSSTTQMEFKRRVRKAMQSFLAPLTQLGINPLVALGIEYAGAQAHEDAKESVAERLGALQGAYGVGWGEGGGSVCDL